MGMKAFFTESDQCITYSLSLKSMEKQLNWFEFSYNSLSFYLKICGVSDIKMGGTKTPEAESMQCSW